MPESGTPYFGDRDVPNVLDPTSMKMIPFMNAINFETFIMKSFSPPTLY